MKIKVLLEPSEDDTVTIVDAEEVELTI